MPRHLTALAAAGCLSIGILAAPSPVAAAEDVPFACDPGLYQVIAGQLAEFDAGAGTFTPMGADGANYNAIGHRLADGLLYGIRGDLLLRIDATGKVTELGSVDIVPGSYTGDFGDDGRLHVSRGGNDWYAIDVDTLAAERIDALSQGRSVADVTNISGRFYGVSGKGQLWIFDPVAGTVSDGGMVSGVPDTSKAYGAAWSTAGGNLYVGRNSGEVYQVTGYSTGSPLATQVAAAPATNSNDGASCPLAAPPQGIADVDGPTPEVAPSTPEATAAAEAYETTYVEPSFAIADAGIGTGASCEATTDEDRPPRVTVESSTVTTATPRLTTDFDAGAPGWRILSGSWQVSDGAFRQLNDCGFDYTALYEGLALRNVEVDVRFASIDGANQGGVVVHQSAVQTRAGAVLVDLADDGATLRWGVYDEVGRYENVGWDLIPAPAPGEPVSLVITARGDQITIVHNGNVVTTMTAPSDSGMVGLVASQSRIAFEAVTITELPA